jgi:hypothetical protein
MNKQIDIKTQAELIEFINKKLRLSISSDLLVTRCNTLHRIYDLLKKYNITRRVLKPYYNESIIWDVKTRWCTLEIMLNDKIITIRTHSRLIYE